MKLAALRCYSGSSRSSSQHRNAVMVHNRNETVVVQPSVDVVIIADEIRLIIV